MTPDEYSTGSGLSHDKTAVSTDKIVVAISDEHSRGALGWSMLSAGELVVPASGLSLTTERWLPPDAPQVTTAYAQHVTVAAELTGRHEPKRGNAS